MIINLSQQIALKGKSNTFRTAKKSFESNIIPHKGDFISDTAFKDPYEYKVVEVIIDYQENICHVTLHMIEIDSDDETMILNHLEMYASHDWNYMKL